MADRKKIINELQFQLNSKEVKDQHYPVQLSDSDANAILALLKEQTKIIRCKDCRKNMMCEMTIHKPKDWFCADGKGREENA